MCLAIPGKVVEVNENKFIIDYGKEKREAIMSVVDGLKLGDYVIVNNKVIIIKLKKEEAEKALELMEKIKK